MSSREQFEEWARSQRSELDKWARGERCGEYKNPVVAKMWQAWQASRVALEIALPVLEQHSNSCSWVYDENDHYWSSSCGEDWCFTDGGPEENRVKFCQGCGRPVVLEQQEKGDDGWIEWGGGENPAEGKLVQVEFRDGFVDDEQPSGGYRWHHEPNNCDIIAYRVVQQERERGEEE